MPDQEIDLLINTNYDTTLSNEGKLKAEFNMQYEQQKALYVLLFPYKKIPLELYRFIYTLNSYTQILHTTPDKPSHINVPANTNKYSWDVHFATRSRV